MPTFTELSNADRADIFIETACLKFGTTLKDLASPLHYEVQQHRAAQHLAAALLEFELMALADIGKLLGQDDEEVLRMVGFHKKKMAYSQDYRNGHLTFVRACGEAEGVKMAKEWINQLRT